MPVSAQMKDHLAGNVLTLCEVWEMVAANGQTARYCNHTRRLAIDGENYYAAPVEFPRPARSLGLEPNTAELTGVLDAQVTKPDLYAGVWDDARVRLRYVNCMDLTMGGVAEQRGFAANISLRGKYFTVQMDSLSRALQQSIGALTSPIDRQRTLIELGANELTFSHDLQVVDDGVEQDYFPVTFAMPSANYFDFGRALFTTGASAGRSMEIKTATQDGTLTRVRLQLPMPASIGPPDEVTLLAGYDGKRTTSRDKFALAVNFDGEPDLPGLSPLLRYPLS
jgi:uncharacterized phage protein (TIGR02218 family)